MSIGRRILNLLITLDQFLFCVLCLGRTYPNETASAAAWRLECTGLWSGRLFRPIIDWFFRVFFRDDNHCAQAYMNLLAGKHMPPEYQTLREARFD